ncbi:MAG: hypothetical protein AB8G86_05770 [Saprospiraceae bacterium]
MAFTTSISTNKWLSFAKLAFVLMLPIIFSTCRDNGPGFNMTYQRDFEIPAGLGVFDTHVFELNGIPTNKAAFLSTTGANENEITAILPREAELSLNFANVDFVFVGEVVVEIFTREDNVGIEIFYRDEIPLNTGRSITLFPSLPEIGRYLDGDEFNVRVELRLRDISPQFLETRLDFQFFARLE